VNFGPRSGRRPASPFNPRRPSVRPPSVRRKDPGRGGRAARRRCAGNYTARSQPRRAGVRPAGSHAHTHLQRHEHGSRPAQHSMDCGVERLHAMLTGRRGHGHGAHGCGRPAPAHTFTCNRNPTARRPAHSTSHEPLRRLAQRRRGVDGNPCTPARPAPSHTPGNGGWTRPGLGAGVRRLRLRALPVTRARTAPRPEQDTRDATRARHRARRRGAGTCSLIPSKAAQAPALNGSLGARGLG
jgi:hypothetical protein